jgi:hypothetical protein
MNARTDISDALSHVYWLGGGSGAGKSVMARRLVDLYGMTLYDTDAAMGNHAGRCAAEDCPRLEAFKKMTMDERWANRTPQVMLDTFHWYYGEGFNLIVDDLMSLPRETPVIAEGFRLLANSHQALWLIPTPAFRVVAFQARGTIWDIPNKTSKPEVALQNLLSRDAMFTQRLAADATSNGLATLTVDGSNSEDAVFAEIRSRLNLGHS